MRDAAEDSRPAAASIHQLAGLPSPLFPHCARPLCCALTCPMTLLSPQTGISPPSAPLLQLQKSYPSFKEHQLQPLSRNLQTCPPELATLFLPPLHAYGSLFFSLTTLISAVK